MRALVLEGYHKVSIIEVEDPKPNGRDVLIRVSKCGICGSDFHTYYDRGDEMKGKLLGHEYSGYVVDPGSRKDLSPGDRVTVCPISGCGTCDLCINGFPNLCEEGYQDFGAFADMILVSPSAVIKLKDSITMTEAAMLEPLATSVRGVRINRVFNGARVLVLGLGIIGSTCTSLVRSQGAGKIAVGDIKEDRGKDLLEAGDCDAFFDTSKPEVLEELIRFNDNKKYDIVFECAGAGPALQLAIDSVSRGGHIGLLGANPKPYPFVSYDLVHNEIGIQATYGYTFLDYRRALEMVENGRISVKQYATRTISLDEAPEAFEALNSGRYQDKKVIVDMEIS
ncbi:MAG: zinc-dependent alcohol dehydrogenase [Saccharofermentanales bacterium]|jgi:2-desacetyl-2-hydroxyethyl bacteriochlorophyllide A dehydrogenase